MGKPNYKYEKRMKDLAKKKKKEEKAAKKAERRAAGEATENQPENGEAAAPGEEAPKAPETTSEG